MKRYPEIDILKGFAVICMLIFHLYYYPHQYGFKEITYETPQLLLIAKIAQIIFITCVGINLVFSYSKQINETKKEYYRKQFKRIIKLLLCAICMSVFTYFIFGNQYVKFGILHFISISSLLLLPLIGKPQIIQVLIGCLSILFLFNHLKPELFVSIPPKTAFITGFYSKWGAVDHFPLIPWLIVMCIGVLIGHEYIHRKPDLLPKYIEELPIVQTLQTVGSHSLEIYMIHWVILYIIYSHIYPKFIRNVPS